MYHVRTTTGITLGYVDKPNYVKRSGNTTIVECGESDALGIFLNSTLYHIYGRAAMTGASTEVVIEKVDGGEVVFNTAKTNGDVYNPSTSYTKGSYFIYNNVVYKVKVACSGVTPPNSTYYDAVTIGSELGSLKSEIDTLNGSIQTILPIAGTVLLKVNIMTISSELFGTNAKSASINIDTNPIIGNTLANSGSGILVYSYNPIDLTNVKYLMQLYDVSTLQGGGFPLCISQNKYTTQSAMWSGTYSRCGLYNGIYIFDVQELTGNYYIYNYEIGFCYGANQNYIMIVK